MLRSTRLLTLVIALSAAYAGAVQAQVNAPASPVAQSGPKSAEPPIAPPAADNSPAQILSPVAPSTSSLDAELFYELLLGEMTAREGEPGTGYNLILDAARKTKDQRLYQRAVEIALQSRSGDAAFSAARAWKQEYPQSREANRYILQILLALNKSDETLDALKDSLALTTPEDRLPTINAIPRLYSRATDKKQAADIVERALAPYVQRTDSAAVAWTTIGRMRMAQGDSAAALAAGEKAQAAEPAAQGPAILGLDLMDLKVEGGEALVKKYLAANPAGFEIRLGYARSLLQAQRFADASAQLTTVSTQKADLPEVWLMLGSLQLQDNKEAEAERSLLKYVELMKAAPQTDEAKRTMAQAYVSLAQLAEKRKDFAAANNWLNQIDTPSLRTAAQTRRAALLARQGKIPEARAMIRAIPAATPEEERAKVLDEVELLREYKMDQEAYDFLAKASAAAPQDTELLYNLAMAADRLKKYDEMEKLLRQVMVLKPDYQHAYNALGYSFAERGIRLGEARDLINKALQITPGDPFITDSLAWVEFRAGNNTEAVRLLTQAFKTRPDAEIAAHLGEVLWTIGDKTQATAYFREGLQLNPDNDTLNETLKRLKVKP